MIHAGIELIPCSSITNNNRNRTRRDDDMINKNEEMTDATHFMLDQNEREEEREKVLSSPTMLDNRD
jgi:hypothetical protein